MPVRKPDGTVFKAKKGHYPSNWRLGNKIPTNWVFKTPVFISQQVESQAVGGSPSPETPQDTSNFFRTNSEKERNLPYSPSHIDNTGNAFPYHAPLITMPAQIGNRFFEYRGKQKHGTTSIYEDRPKEVFWLGFFLYPYCNATTWTCCTYDEDIIRLYYQGELTPWRHVYANGFEGKSFMAARYEKQFIITNLILGDYGEIPSDRFTRVIPEPLNVIYPPE